MPSAENTLQRVKNITVDQLGVRSEDVHSESSIIDGLGADSLDVVELIMAVEKEFGIEIPDEDAEKIFTVLEMATYVDNHL